MARTPLVAVGLLLAACSPTAPLVRERSVPTPTLPTSLPTVTTTPLLASWVSERVIRYRQALTPEPGETAYNALRVRLEVKPLEAALQAARAGEVELVIAGSHPPDGWFATPIGEELIAVVVHPRNPVADLDLETIRDLFAGFIGDWEVVLPASLMAQPVIPLPGDESRMLLEREILGSRRPALTSLIGPSPAAIEALVAEHEGAIGLLPAGELTSGVRAVRVGGIEPSRANLADGSYPLRLQLVAFAPQEPAEDVRDWLVWLQEMRLSSAQ